MSTIEEQSCLNTTFDDLGSISIEFNPNHESHSAYFFYYLVCLLQYSQLLYGIATHFFYIVKEVFIFNRFKYCYSCCACQWISAKSGSMTAGDEALCYFFFSGHSSNSHAAAERLCQCHYVGFYIIMLISKIFSVPAHAALHLIENELQSFLITELSNALHEFFCGDVNPAFTLNRFQHDGTGYIIYLFF